MGEVCDPHGVGLRKITQESRERGSGCGYGTVDEHP
jgi:hypothetical protein